MEEAGAKAHRLEQTSFLSEPVWRGLGAEASPRLLTVGAEWLECRGLYLLCCLAMSHLPEGLLSLASFSFPPLIFPLCGCELRALGKHSTVSLCLQALGD